MGGIFDGEYLGICKEQMREGDDADDFFRGIGSIVDSDFLFRMRRAGCGIDWSPRART
jgi:hypothetical protein